jgi:hypothetical protein
MLQIPWKMRGLNSKNAANTVEMAPSSSKMLQIARKMDRTGNPPKKQNGNKNTSPNNFRP